MSASADFDRDALTLGVRARIGLTLLLALLLALAYGLAAGALALATGLGVTALGAAQASRPAERLPALRFLLISAEFALVTAVLLYAPALPGIAPYPKAMLSHSPAILLLFAMVAVHVVTVRPRATWWAGASALLCWGAAEWITQRDPATLTKAQVLDADFETLFDYLGAIMQPRYLSLDAVWLQMCVLAGCTLILGIAAWRMRILARDAAARQAAVDSLSGHFAAPVAAALLSQGLQRPERMELAVLDCDLVGFSGVAARLDPEAVAAGLRAYHGFVEQRVFDHGGAVLKYSGDGVTAVFGFTGDAGPAGRALDCARTLVAEWNIAGTLFASEAAPALVVGVDHGEVLAGIVGEGRALSLVVTGPPVEGAARLQSRRGNEPPVRFSDAATR